MRTLLPLLMAMINTCTVCIGQSPPAANNAPRVQLWLGGGMYNTFSANTNSGLSIDEQRVWHSKAGDTGLAIGLNYQLTRIWFVTANGYWHRNRYADHAHHNLTRGHLGFGGIVPLQFLPKLNGHDWLSVGGQWELGRIGGWTSYIAGDTWNHGGTVLLRLRISNSFAFTSKGSWYWNREDDLHGPIVVPQRHRHIGVRAGLTYTMVHKKK